MRRRSAWFKYTIFMLLQLLLGAFCCIMHLSIWRSARAEEVEIAMDGARGIDFHYDFSYSYCWDHLRYSVRRALLPGVVLKVSNCCRVCMTGNNAGELSMTETSLCELDWGYIRPEFNQSVQICSNLFRCCAFPDTVWACGSFSAMQELCSNWPDGDRYCWNAVGRFSRGASGRRQGTGEH